MADEMSREQAIAYLKRKGKEQSEENIKKCMTSGKCFGDPVAVIDW